MKYGSYLLIGNFVTALPLYNKNLITYIIIPAQESGTCAAARLINA